jgi:hypothetical protein
LEKNETNRLRAIADARLEIDDAQQSDRVPSPSRTDPPSRTERLVWTSAVALLGVALVGLGVWSIRPLAAPPEVRFDITTPEAANQFLVIMSFTNPTLDPKRPGGLAPLIWTA